MARPIAAPIITIKAPWELQPGTSIANLPLTDGDIIPVNDMSLGMVDGLPRDKTPLGSAKIIKNGRTRGDGVIRREGTDEVGTKPDSNRVIGVFSIVHEDGSKHVCRVTQSTFHTWDGSDWVAFTVVGGFKGTALRVTASQLFGKVYLAFGIGDGLWEVDFTLKTVTRVDEAPGAKFTYTFAERICVANIFKTLGGHFPNAVAWSANSDPQDWEGESAGEEDFIADELGNEITGVVSMEREAVIIRRHSIVHQVRQPFALAPFRFDTVVKGIGSNLPYSTVLTTFGVIFADQATSDVYLYRPGSFPQSLAAVHQQGHLHHLLYEDLAQAQHSEATFDPKEGEYHLGLVWTTDNELITRHWICNLHRGYPVWSYDDSPTLSTFGVVIPPPAATSIDDLSGTINALTGSIDSLSSRAVLSAALFAGVTTGEVIDYSHDHATDWDGTAFEFLYQSQNIGNPVNRRTMKDLELNCSIPVTGSVTIEQSKDDSNWTNTKTATRTGATGKQKVRLPKTQITGDDLWWRVKSTAARFKIHNWWARVMDKGLQQGGQQ